MKFVFLGLSITSSWGNGHATTYRGLVRGLASRGHEVLFLERDKPWYAGNRDLPHPPYCVTRLYTSLDDLRARFTDCVADADCVIVGSYVPEGVRVGEWVLQTAHGVTAFYDIDTPVTLAKLARGDYEYLTPGLIPRYQLYLSFTGGPTLNVLEDGYGSPRARALYCSVDADLYSVEAVEAKWTMGYLGTYSPDRQPTVEKLLLEPAQQLQHLRFAVAGPQYPQDVRWPWNVTWIHHLPPPEHRMFYNQQLYTLNVTRADMIRAGYSPSVRLFEAAACGTPIISDRWDGLETVFEPGSEILIADSSKDVLRYLTELSSDERTAIGQRARQRVLGAHTALHRAQELEDYLGEIMRVQMS